MKVYKCIWISTWSDVRFTSLVARGPAETRYKVDEWAYAPDWLARLGYHLTAFRTLEQAIQFRHDFIYEAVAEDPIQLPPKLDTYYLQLGIFKEDEDFPNWPIGTVMYKKIKLLRRAR